MQKAEDLELERKQMEMGDYREIGNLHATTPYSPNQHVPQLHLLQVTY